MSEKETVKAEHKNGPAWISVRTLASFEEASSLKKTILQDTTQEAKIKKTTNKLGEEVFVVKKRTKNKT